MLLDLSSPYVHFDPVVPESLTVVVTTPHGSPGLVRFDHDDNPILTPKLEPDPNFDFGRDRQAFSLKPCFRMEPIFGRFKAYSRWENVGSDGSQTVTTAWTLLLAKRASGWQLGFRVDNHISNGIFGRDRLWFIMLPGYDPDFELADRDRRTIYEVLMDDET